MTAAPAPASWPLPRRKAADRQILSRDNALPCVRQPDLFFSRRKDDTEAAIWLCQGCPVRPECLAGALERREPEGIWGGERFPRAWRTPQRAAAAPRKPRPTPERVLPARETLRGKAANEGRAARAAANACWQVRQALDVLGDSVPPHLAAAAQLRLSHPGLALPQIASLADEPLSKDTLAGRLRRLIEAAERKASMREVAA